MKSGMMVGFETELTEGRQADEKHSTEHGCAPELFGVCPERSIESGLGDLCIQLGDLCVDSKVDRVQDARSYRFRDSPRNQ